MPKVGKKEFPYTAKGMAMAKMEAKKTGKKMTKKKTAKKKPAKRGLFGGK
jgi:hypothetical protein